MNIALWLKQAKGQLKNIPTARLDALVLLEDCSGKDRAWLLAHPEFELSDMQGEKLEKLLARRAQHEPLAYLRGKTEFYGREFVVSAAVLEPRPESETMIDLLKKLPKLAAKPSIADVGTGSGALGITAALELPEATVELLEIDPAAIKIARANVDKLSTGILVLRSDLLAESSQDYDVLLCNLPYVPDDFAINTAATHEPRLAIFGGPDGLDLYRRLFTQIQNAQKQPLYILTEALPSQHDALEQIAKANGYKLHASDDFIQVFEYSA